MCECGQLHTNAKRLTVDQDPTRQGGNRRKAEKELIRRLVGAQAEIKQYLLSLPTTKRQAPDGNSLLLNREVYEYQPDTYAQLRQFIAQTINKWLELGGTGKPPKWFFDTQIMAAYDSGASETIATIALLLALLPAKRTLIDVSFENIVVTYGYRQRMQYSLEQSYTSVQKLGNDVAADAARAVSEKIDSGMSPVTLAAAAALVFDKARKRSKLIAENEINNAFRKAKQAEAEALAAALGLNIKVLHRSALLPTTRAWHAARHGKIYTIQEQAIWWSQDANSINCHCSVSEVIVDADGKIYDLGMQKKLIAQRQSYFGLAA